ncbi:S-adenosylhomocysteine deaminase Methylthioadenosine deaminase [Desulfurella amilsii]|uniref:S-adenosylhomocysteine deaminase Methylthioadenosine deaminase n=1 Tax=Desulfurella amilsii TaxID=1562698 RepID=A0A1X4XYY2_9BACT|nr:amidohydrolase family protein [Desulfurella amilsii]OSS42745.1 S-adenosylhomocysteine deaminase Methylthioadenosine deaminase [Desulfurella amilsii]OSS42821.1 S-adenosylhomocysteine deaminase Methylthioadenosine deaminase [Desulfurella amilsii]
MEMLYAKWLFNGKEILKGLGCVSHNNMVVDLLPIKLAKKTYPEAVVKDYGEGVLFSGFVNAHTHLDLSNVSIEPYLGFVKWLKTMIETKVQANETQTDEAIKKALDSLIKSGVCAVADISNTLKSCNYLKKIPKAIVFFENYSLRKKQAQEKIAYIENNIENIRQTYKMKIDVTAHSVYSTHRDLLGYTMLKNNPKFGSDLFSFHFLESEFENPFVNSRGDLFEMLQEKGLIDNQLHFSSAIEYIKSLGDIKKGLFVHCVHIKPDEIEYLKSIDASIVIAPRSNYYISKSLPNLELLKNSGINVAIGTDSLASNWDLNIINELKFLYKHYSHIDPAYFFGIATTGGYTALNLHIGFKKGFYAYPFFMETTTNNALEEILQ